MPDVYSVQNYYAFGQSMPNWSATAAVNDAKRYRFGMNGEEEITEWGEQANFIGFTERMYDARTCRWISLDGASGLYPSLSPYIYVGNSPNLLLEKDGHFIGTIIGAALGAYNAHKNGTSVFNGS
jgi:RHS repeat-associated protein